MRTRDDRAAVDDAIPKCVDVLGESAEASRNRAAVGDAAAERRDFVDEYATYPRGNLPGVDNAPAKGIQKRRAG